MICLEDSKTIYPYVISNEMLEIRRGIAAYVNLPFSMPLEGHNTIFVTNAIMEAIDLDKKKVKNI